MKKKKIKVVVIGGGTGTMAVLNGLKNYSEIDLAVVVSMMDDGGSNKIIRDDFGILPLSDLRKSIIALSGVGDSIFRELFQYRFDKSKGLKGHTLGNLILTALVEITGSEILAIKEMCKIFSVKGKILPVTLDDVRLVAKCSNGKIIKGEHLIDEPVKKVNYKIEKIYLEPKAKAYSETLQYLINADFIIIGPGDLYTSTLANIVVDGIPEAIQKSKAKIIFISNLMTKNGQTNNMKASNLKNEVERYIGKKIDIILLNNKKIPNSILKKYKEKNEEMIVDDLSSSTSLKVIRTDLIGKREIKTDSGDTLIRSLIRHDENKTGKVLASIILRSQ